MKKFFITFLFFVYYYGFSQSNKVVYSIKSDLNNVYNLPIQNEAILIFDDKISLFKEFTIKEKNKLVKAKDSTSNIKFIDNIDTLFVYKDIKKNYLNTEVVLFVKKKYIKDSLNLFDWKITNETQKILNYECNVATTFFRGRNYKAYFYKNKKYKNGPFKFGELPGLILKLEVTDSNSFYEMVATEIVLDSSCKDKIYNPYIEKEIITYGEFKDFHDKKIEALKSYFAEKGETVIFGNGSLEKLIDD